MNLLKLLATLGLDSSEYEKGIKGASSTISSFGSVFGTVMKTGAAAMAAASGAVAAFGKQAVDSYANYEQLEGGVKKLFGDASADILQFANDAYKTSGMSANAYLETATSFSAAMIKSLGGDTAEAARITDIAMQAMSDNVNTFGSDMGAVQNAFMGLSRQNYTMLDNLKLGYAGTAQGMLELINDSGVLGHTLTDVSELADVGFANMVLAIQKVQENQHIAGTTAKEAMTTIEGSANATKAAWDNVILAIGRGDGLSEAFSSLTSALFGANEGEGLLNQLIPRVQMVMEGVGDFVVSAAPLIADKFPQLVTAIIPSVLSSAAALVSAFGQSLFNLVTELYPQVVDSGLQLINKLASGFVEGIPQFLSKALPMLVSFTGELRNNIGLIVDAGIDLITNFVQGLINAMPDLIAYIPEIVINIAGIINDNLPKIIEAGFNIIVSLIKGIIDNIPNLISNAGRIVTSIVSVIQAFNWLSLGSNLLTLFTNGIKAIAMAPVEMVRNIGRNIFNVFKNGFSWSSLGSAIVSGIVQGIGSVGSAIGETLMGFARSAFNSVKHFFGIASPSKLMRDQIGKFIPEGIAVGIDANADAVEKSMENLSSIAVDGFDTGSIPVKNMDTASYTPTNVTLNVYGAEGQDVRELARIVMEEMNKELNSRRVVYA